MTRFLQILRRYIFPLLPTLCAVALIVIQQTYYPFTHPIVLINILLLTMNLLEFAPLLISRSVNSVLHLSGTGFIAILAFLFNIEVGGISTPLSDFKAFLDSVCGLWTAILIVELVCLYRHFVSSRRGMAPEQSFTGTNTGETSSGGSTGSGSVDNASGRNRVLGQSGPPASNRNMSLDTALGIANKYLIIYALAAVLLPFANWALLEQSGWMTSVRAIDQLIYGNKIRANNAAVLLLLYLLALFVIFIAVIVGINIVKYVLARHLSHNSQDDFFEQYSTPIVVLVVAGAVVLAIRGTTTGEDTGGLWTDAATLVEDTGSLWADAATLLGYITNLFAYMLAIIVAIIALLVAFETIRLVLNQCTKRGSLLKGSMQLVFILIVQYAMGLLMGVLRIFALRDVIESLLLFFLPDLDQSVEPEVKQVLDAGLKREVRQVSRDMHITQTKWEHQRQKPSGYRIVRKRRRRK